MNFKAVTHYLLDRLSEPSSWRGCCLILTGVFGYTLPAGLTLEQVVSIGLTVTGLIGAATSDRGNQKSQAE